MRANLEREIAAAALSGDTGPAPVLELFRNGLTALRSVRNSLRDAGLDNAVALQVLDRKARGYVSISLPRGVKARLYLASRLVTGRVGAMPLMTIHPVRGRVIQCFDVPPAVGQLVHRVGTNVDAAVRVALGIERARQRCFELCEERSRWL